MKRFAALAPSLLVVGVFLADRLTKSLALRHLRPIDGVALTPFFHLTYVENTGAAFGLGARRNGFFIAVSILLMGGLLHLRRRWPKDNAWLQYGAMLVIGGALGNLYDRLVYGCVVDFLDFRVWPVFNLADSCVSVGACCLAWGFRKEG
ncbi:MAG: signal peptidase II [Elusimicrobia bacterium]|nr:signal peptidase II [Elusimicrobiota bacterium]